MKKSLLICSLVLSGLISTGQSKIKNNSKDSIPAMRVIDSLNIQDISKFKELLKSVPYQDYIKLSPDVVLDYLIGWIKNGKK